ncbi:hypothetical protein J057_24475 [Marinobacter nanhaiticus D15-8W]|uniref:Outer membrane protein beta-barrel domain-containing protein n=1 Tax=Marinobacter nanhaiticus D15-8W TaxID=626887 RepID=A0A371CGA2_9GAMM|nr:hypothetical protein J057_24475 [Marinobacter nanhaiticus D15-8W]
MPDYVETKDGTNPSDPKSFKDSDGDDVPDYIEEQWGSDPNDPRNFTDGDGDGVPDYIEVVEGTDPDVKTNFPDTDGDGVPDYYEVHNDGTDPGDVNSVRDANGNGQPDYVEKVQGDTTPPQVTAPPAVTVNATGLYTKITRAQLESLGVASASDSRDGASCCSPYPKSLVDNEPFFAPGKHRIVWAATDDSGNVGTAEQVLNVKPLISLSKDQTVPEGAIATIKVVLNGPAPSYPVEVPYTVAGNAENPSDHNLVSGKVVINAGLQALIKVDVRKDGIPEADENLILTLGKDVNRSPSFRHVMTISERNIEPHVSLSVVQDGENRMQLLRDGGPVMVKATVTDSNLADSHTYSWDTGYLIDGDSSNMTVTLDPSVMESGQAYPVKLSVSDDGIPSLSSSATVYLQIVEALPTLSATTDSDGDGIADADEGYGDADQDGIPDYLDSQLNACSVVAEEAKDYQRYLMESDPGSCLKLGVYSRFAMNGGSHLVAGHDIGALSVTRLPEDSAATNVGGVFDFMVEDLARPGDSVRVVVPQRAAIPENAIYRKYNAVGGWMDFREDSKNNVKSAAGEPGFCPTAGSDAYTDGLKAGHWCVQLTIEDGGPNDDDGEVNGTVVDPGGVAVISGLNNSGTLKTSGGGGAFGPFTLLVLMAGGVLVRAARQRAAGGAQLLGSVVAVGLAFSAVLQSPDTYASEGSSDKAPVYLTASLGYAYTDIDARELEGRFADRGYQASVISEDGDRLAGMIGAGYRLNDQFAVEVAYIDLGDTEVHFQSTPINRKIAEVHPESGQGPAASVTYRYGLGERWGLGARVGVFFWEGDYGTSQGGVAVADTSDDGTDLYYGIGADYRYSELLSLRTEVQRFEFDRDPTYYVSAGLDFHFPLLFE